MKNQTLAKTKTKLVSGTTNRHVTASRLFTRNNTVRITSFCKSVVDKFRVSEKQTVAFNIKARVDFKTRRRARMSVWDAMEMLNTLIDESDPDVSSVHQLSPSSI
jgi:Myo-inositol oxygenase